MPFPTLTITEVENSHPRRKLIRPKLAGLPNYPSFEIVGQEYHVKPSARGKVEVFKDLIQAVDYWNKENK